MSNKLKYLLIILLINSSVAKSQPAYFKKDTVLTYGATIIDNGNILNALQCVVKIKGKPTVFTPLQVSEYKLKDGRVYISRTILCDSVERRVFLNRLNKGKINLYYFQDSEHRKFFIEKDSQLTELNRKGPEFLDFRNQIRHYVSDCEFVTEEIKFLKYNHSVLSKFIYQYNKCDKRQFPYFKYGFYVGYSFSKLKDLGNNQSIFGKFLSRDYSFYPGVFCDIPIKMSNLSIHPEIYYQKNSFNNTYREDNNIMHIITDFSTINIPLFLRYTYPSVKFKPYLDAGLNYSNIIRDDTRIYETTILDDNIEIQKINYQLFSRNQFGFSIGGGIGYKLRTRGSVFIEVRYNNIYSVGNEKYINKNFMIQTGISY